MTYPETLNDILVFKTDICEAGDLEKIATVLNNERRIRKWNVDRSDVDRVLRVQGERITPEEIAARIRKAGFRCEELPD